MSIRFPLLVAGSVIATACASFAQEANLSFPRAVQAGSAFSMQTTGNGLATLYIVGPLQVMKRDVQLGQTVYFSSGSLYNAGHYLAVLSAGSSAQHIEFDVLPNDRVADLSFLAKPSRLPVGIHGGITGAIYAFDAYHNLIVSPSPITFQLSNPSGMAQSRTVMTRQGAAWTALDSSAQQGIDKLVARADGVANTRVISQVPGDPCGLKMTAHAAGAQIALETEPVRDCSGNAVPDGTIVTFTEAFDSSQSTVDVPIKRGVAKVELPAHNGATISAACGVILGNQIRWEK